MLPEWVIPLSAIIAATMTSVWSLAWWLSGKFSSLEKAITDKLEYHERHDDQRFAQLTNDIWALRLRILKDKGIDIGPTQESKDTIPGIRNQAFTG